MLSRTVHRLVALLVRAKVLLVLAALAAGLEPSVLPGPR
jgi:hypothetical protein